MNYDRIIQYLLAFGRLRVLDDSSVEFFNHRSGDYEPVKTHEDKDGYLRVTISVFGKTRHLRLHRIVWVAYHGATPLEIDHLDGDRQHCHIRNLFAVTRQENEIRKKERAFYQPEPEREPSWEPF